MQIDLLKSVVMEIAGTPASGLVGFLHNKKNINEFLIAKKLKLTINQTRNILYKLADEGIVSFVRKKDKKKGGWYIYFWTLNAGKGLLKFKEHLVKKIETLRAQVDSRKSGRFYYCVNCNIESDEETSLLYQYTCPECGEVLQLKDKSKEIEVVEKELIRLEGILNNVEHEIGLVVKKEDVAKVRKNKAEVKKKLKERALRKKKKELELKKTQKKKKSIKVKNVKSKSVKKKKEVSKLGKGLAKLFRR